MNECCINELTAVAVAVAVAVDCLALREHLRKDVHEATAAAVAAAAGG